MKTNKMTKALVMAVAMLALGQTARAAESPAAAAAKADIQKTLGFVPQFFLKFPEGMLAGAWEEMKTLQLNPHTALAGRTKELIGLGVAAQIPCHYCIYAHTSFARLNGASDTEIGEAVAMAALTRHWSTYLNGIQTDEAKFRGEIAKIVENVKHASATKTAAPAPVTVVDGASALKEVTQMLGYAPDFLRTFPEEARAGAWKQFRDVQLNPGNGPGRQEQGAGRPGGGLADPLQVLHHRPHRVRQAERRHRRRDSRGDRHGLADPGPQHHAERHAGRRAAVPSRHRPPGQGRQGGREIQREGVGEEPGHRAAVTERNRAREASGTETEPRPQSDRGRPGSSLPRPLLRFGARLSSPPERRPSLFASYSSREDERERR